MYFPMQVDTSIRGRMADIKRAFEADAFLSAIALALTIPDMCGKRLYPDERKSSDRYIRWFDEYMAPNYPDVCTGEADEVIACSDASAQYGTIPGRYYFSGNDCYQLRCVYLHEGSNAPHCESIEKGKTVYNVIQFRVFDPPGNCDHVGYLEESPNGDRFRQVDLDLHKFLEYLDIGVEAFLREYPEMDEDKGSESFFYRPVLDFRTHEATR